MSSRSACSDHWADYAARWRLVGSPLRPNQQDLRLMQDGLCLPGNVARAKQSMLLLGVTPEIAALRWPHSVHLYAVDHAFNMIKAVWPCHGDDDRSVVCADWRDLPYGDGVMDVVIGDGCFTTLVFPGDCQRVVSELHRVLVPDGLFLIRSFLRPTPGESLKRISDDLFEGTIDSFHVLKWRIAHALCGDPLPYVRLTDIWSAWLAMCHSASHLADMTGWPVDVIKTIEAYRDNLATYTFPTMDELRCVLSPFFSVEKVTCADYQLGDLCPILLCRRS